MQEIINCPTCQRKLQVPDSLIGQDVQCPTCGGVFIANIGSTSPVSPPGPPIPPPMPDLSPAHPDEERPRRRRVRFEEDYSGEDYDEDYRDRPRRRGRRRDLHPHRGGTVLTLGIVALVTWFTFCLAPVSIIIGPIAWIMGSQDLSEIKAGRMDPEGESQLQAGKICGIIATILSLLTLLGWCFLFGTRTMR